MEDKDVIRINDAIMVRIIMTMALEINLAMNLLGLMGQEEELMSL